MTYPTFQEFSKLARDGNWVPLWATVPADLLTPVSAYLKLTEGLRKRSPKATPFSFLLESVEGGENVARYTYIGADPEMVLRFWIEPNSRDAGRSKTSPQARYEVLVAGHKETMRGDFLSLTRQIFAGFRVAPAEGLPPFTNGAVGYFGYDMVSLREPVPLRTEKPSDKPMPDAVLMFASTVMVFDHVKHQIWIVCNAACEEGMTRAEQERLYQHSIRKSSGSNATSKGRCLPLLRRLQ